MGNGTKALTKEIRNKFSALYIDPLAMKKIQYYADAADGEVSGFGILEKDAEGRYIVTEVFLLEQECTGADTEIDPEALSKLMVDLMQAGKDPGKLKFWWHSHVNMGVFWSGTDEIACDTLSREFAFSLVVNKMKERKCRLDIYNPFRLTVDNITVNELPDNTVDPLKEACAKEVKEKVKAPYQGFKKGTGYVYEPGVHNRYPNGGYDDAYGDYDDYGRFGGESFVPGGRHNDYPPYRGMGAKRGHGFFGGRVKDEKIKLPDPIVADIERLLGIATSNEAMGGVFSPETWQEYLQETLKSVAEMRLEPKAKCHSPLTYSETYADCTNGSCPITKTCKYFTRFFHETEQDAQKELEDLKQHPEDIGQSNIVC